MRRMKNFGPFSPRIHGILHGADYNPDQWLDRPDILEQDIQLMHQSGMHVMSIGIFSWAKLEPAEGQYDFLWLDMILDRLYAEGISVILATPSAALPAWMSQAYPEVLRMDENRVRHLHGGRQNHCFTSPVYREKVRTIDTLLAQRYGRHPAVIAWHVSNEFEGYGCHCPLCQEAFRSFLKARYHDDLEALNHAWWTSFWSHTYRDWSEIESPSPIGEHEMHGLTLDWHRFVSAQTLDFLREECRALRAVALHLPLTTNFHDFVQLERGLDYWKLAEELDVISWDDYPYWHADKHSDAEEAARRAFIHDMNRSFKQGKPFLLMESSPSATNWQPVAKLRRPGMHALASIQAVAHGADTVQYFQWRKSLGGSEKFHGAVVDHNCDDPVHVADTRVFREVTALGRDLDRLLDIVGTSVAPEVAIIYDWENAWILADTQGPRQEGLDYFDTCVRHYKAFWDRGVAVDVINADQDLSRYKLVIAPMLYMVRPGFGAKIEAYVQAGGHFVTTYWSGIADETDLCFTAGKPGPLRRVLGIWSEEIDVLYDSDINHVGGYEARLFCDLIHTESAETVLTYDDDFYAGRPALTCNRYGTGEAWYIAFRSYDTFLSDFYDARIRAYGIELALDVDLPEGVTATVRADEEHCFCFLQNFTDRKQSLRLKAPMQDLLTGKQVQTLEMDPYSYQILS